MIKASSIQRRKSHKRGCLCRWKSLRLKYDYFKNLWSWFLGTNRSVPSSFISLLSFCNDIFRISFITSAAAVFPQNHSARLWLSVGCPGCAETASKYRALRSSVAILKVSVRESSLPISIYFSSLVKVSIKILTSSGESPDIPNVVLPFFLRDISYQVFICVNSSVKDSSSCSVSDRYFFPELKLIGHTRGRSGFDHR